MTRLFLSLLLAVVATIGGLVLTWHGATTALMVRNTFQPEPGADVLGITLAVVGILLLGLAAFSVALHWAGALVVGAIHALLGLLALVIPFGNPLSGGVFSPVFQIVNMLPRRDLFLSDGAAIFYFSGTAFVIGAFLVAAALGIRSRRVSGTSGVTATVVSSILGALVLLAATGLLFLAGGPLVRDLFMTFRFDVGLAALAVLAGLLAGVAGLLLRWSSFGVAIAAVTVVVAGFALLLTNGLGLGMAFPGVYFATYGFVAVAGVTFLGAALGALVRGADAVPATRDAL